MGRAMGCILGSWLLLLVCDKVNVSLFSDTDGVVIYYTLNGSKPEPFRTIGPAAKSTILYQDPFVLTPGKRTIKAVAVTRLDGSAFVGL